MASFSAAVADGSVWRTVSLIHKNRKVLSATVQIELAKRYSGSVLGKAWLVLQPALLLSVYLFVYLVVFQMRFPDISSFEYVLYVFCGMIPYLGCSEAITTGCQVLKQNMHLLKNVMMPIELVPVRSVVTSLAGQIVSLCVLLALLAVNGNLGINAVWLPAVFVLQVLMLIGIVFILSVVALVLPDIAYFVNLAILLLMFVSPIGFRPDMIPVRWRFMVYGNPIYYMIETYRSILFENKMPSPLIAIIYAVICLGTFALGSGFLRRFKAALVDYE
jgi:lipopolysaccharide transport system permease protein